MYYDKLACRTDKGDTPYNLRSCEYMDLFSKQKLVWTPVNSEYRFAIIPKDIYFNNSLFMITGEKLEFLCGILNSKLYIYYFKMLLSNGSYAYGSRDFFMNIPIRDVNNNDIERQITEKVQSIYPNNSLDEIENEITTDIDNLVFDLYDLSDSEKKYVQNQFKIL